MAHTPQSKLKKYPEISSELIRFEFFETPREPILSLLNNGEGLVNWSNARVLDVGAGRGNIGRTIREATGAIVDSIEIRELERNNLVDHSDNLWMENFLQWTPPDGYKPDIIITNPPFSMAVDIAEQSFRLFPNCPLVMLQRLEWLGSKKRTDFFNANPVQGLWTLSHRPSFLGSHRKVDVWSYSWFMWDIPEACHGIKSI